MLRLASLIIQDDIVINTGFANCDRAEVEGLIGFFTRFFTSLLLLRYGSAGTLRSPGCSEAGCS